MFLMSCPAASPLCGGAEECCEAALMGSGGHGDPRPTLLQLRDMVQVSGQNATQPTHFDHNQNLGTKTL